MRSNFNDLNMDKYYYDCEVLCDDSKPRFKDRLSEDCGYAITKEGYTENVCVTDLMVYIKYHVESQFMKPINLLNGACSLQKRTRFTKTGNFNDITLDNAQ